jgi:hypothetical protein
MSASAIWFFTSFGGYFNSDRYAMLGKMAALFGGRFLQNQCRPMAQSLQPAAIFRPLAEVVVCMVMTTTVTILLHSRRPSEVAHAGLCKILEDLRDVCGKVYTDSSPASLVPASLEQVVRTGETIESDIIKIQSLNTDAIQEFRFWRPKWRHVACKHLVWTCHHIATQIGFTAKVLLRCKRDGQAAVVSKCLRLDAIKALVALNQQGLLALEHVASILVADDEPALVASQKAVEDDDLQNPKVITRSIGSAREAAYRAFGNGPLEQDQGASLAALLQIVDSLGLSCRLTFFCKVQATYHKLG